MRSLRSLPSFLCKATARIRTDLFHAKLDSGLSLILYASLHCKLGSNSYGIAYDSEPPEHPLGKETSPPNLNFRL